MPSSTRRRRLRWLIYTPLGCLAVAGILLAMALRSTAVREELRLRIVEAAERALGRPVTVGPVEATLFPPGFVVAGLRAETPLLGATRVEGTFALLPLLRGRLVVEDLDVFEPVLNWDIDEGSLLAPSRPDAEEGRLTLRRLRLQAGTAVVGSARRHFGADLRGVRVQAVNTAPAGVKGPWEGAVSFDHGDLTVDDLALRGLRGSVSLEADTKLARARRLTLRAEGILLRGQGVMEPGRPLRGRFELGATLDPAAPSLQRPLPQLSAREVSLDLLLHLPGEGVALTGSFVLQEPAFDPDRDATADGPLLPWRGERALGTLDLNGERLLVQGRVERMAGGAIETRYEGAHSGERTLEARIVEPLDLAAALGTLPLPGRPEVLPSSAVTGQTLLRWRTGEFAARRGQAELHFAERPGEFPLSGSLAVELSGPRTLIRSADLSFPGGSLSTSGTIDAAGPASLLDLGVTVSAREVTPLAAFLERRFPRAAAGAAGGGAAPRPTDLSGPLELKGQIEGRADAPHVAATFMAAGALFQLPVRGNAAEGVIPLPIQRAEGSLDYRDGRLDLRLRELQGEGLSLTAHALADTRRGRLISSSIEAAEAPASLLARLAGLDLGSRTPEGAVRFKADLTGAGDEMTGRFDLSAAAVAFGNLPVEGLQAAGTLEPGRVVLEAGSLTLFGGTLTGDGSYPLDGGTSGGIDLTLGGLDLTRVAGALGGPALGGRLDATGGLRPGPSPRLEMALAGEEVSIAGVALGRIAGTLSGPADALKLTLDDTAGLVKATADFLPGIAEEGGGTRLDAQVKVAGLKLQQLLPLFPPGALGGLRGEADGEVRIRGPLESPRDLQIFARVDRLMLAAGEHELSAVEPLRITIQDGFLTLAPARLVGEGTDLSLGGSMVMGGAHELTAIITGRFDLGLAEVLFPELRASGEGQADLRVIQREDRITYEGTITAAGGRIAHPALPLPLLELSATARFDEDGLFRLEKGQFLIGGGRVTGTGWARFEGASMPGLHLALSGSGIRAELLPDLKAFFDAETSLDRDGLDFHFSGRVSILRAIYSRPFGIEASDLLLRSREFAPAASRREGAPVVRLDLAIDAEGDLWVRNDDALIEAAAHLALGGTLNRPELSGRISALEGGTYRFRDVTYRIVGGAMDFADLTRIDPLMEIEASTRVGSYEVTLRVTGRFSRPVYELTSDPALPQRDIVWLLVTGRTLSDSGSESERALAEGQVASYLAAPVAGAVSAPLEKALGVSSVRIDPFFLNGTADPTARVTVTKRVKSNLLFTYSSSLGAGGQEVYQVEYNPGRLWDVIGTRDIDGSIGADLRFRRRWSGLNPLASPDVAVPADEAGRPLEVVAPSRPRIAAVLVTADRWVGEPEAARRGLKIGPGDPYRRADLLEAREALRQRWVAAGYPAARVDLVEGSGPATGEVTFNIEAGPRHELIVEGEVQHRAARRAVNRAWQEPVLVEELSEAARLSVLDLLRGKGHYGAEVTAGVTDTPEGVRRLTLTAHPGPKVRVREIRITGNQKIDAGRIARQMLTRTEDWIPLHDRGLLREPVLKDDAGAIRSLYLASGFLGVRVRPPVVTLSPDGTEAIVSIDIDEGEQSLVGEVVIEGAAEGVPAEALLRGASLKPGDPISAETASAAADRVRETLDGAGYSRARVDWRLEGSPAATRVVFNLLPLERARIRAVRIEGNSRTRGRIVDREVTLKEGDWYSRNGALTTQRNLYRLGVFRSVQVDPLPLADQPGFVDVRIRVQEGSPILTAWGVGYDSNDRARASFELANNNLFGTRRGAALFLRGSTVDRRAQVTLRDPNLFGERIETLLSGFIERQEFDSFVLHRRGTSAQLTRKLTEKSTIYGRYRLEDIDLSDLQISPEETGQQTVRLGSTALSFSRDTRDDIVNPTRGVFGSIDAGVYAHQLGSEAQFTRIFASGRRFQSLGHSGIVWASSVRAGALTSRDIPVSERFFAGGDTTLRGFSFNEVGPKDPVTGNPVGGEGLFLLNQELRFPILGALKGVLFYDTGNVYSDLSDYDLNDLRHVGGVGLRFDTPVGPFRIEYGHKLDHVLDFDAAGNSLGRRRESRGQFFLSIGQAF